ncbi:hypothetical protein NMY22_g2374 [Coprinellus aureogranulatus]|nr:hypothetical protein NMY22_g2374 [Coprinellus aureogranulatus]
MVLFAFQIAVSWHVPSGYTPGACRAIQTAESLLNHFTLASSDFAMLLCIYALMGARKRYAFLIGSLAIAFYVPVFILATLFTLQERSRSRAGIWPGNRDPRFDFLHHSFVLLCYTGKIKPPASVPPTVFRVVKQDLSCSVTEKNIKIAEPRSPLYAELGWPCEFRFSPSIAYPTGMVVLYLVVTVREHHALFRLLYAISVIGNLVPSQSQPKFRPMAVISMTLDSFMAPVLSAALILNLRRIDNPPSRAIVSALVFAVDNDLARLGHNDNGAAQSSGDREQGELCTETSGGREEDGPGIHEE